jgi:hypothetical protein
MPAVALVRTAWAGASGGPGVTQMAFYDATGADINATQAGSCTAAVRTFWDAIKANIPDNIQLTVSPVVDQYNFETGALTRSVTAASSPATVIGTSGAVFSMASGLKINLNTGVIRFGRRVRGAIYVVPAASTVYTTDGAVLSTVRTSINSAGATMITSFLAAGCNLAVYSRPRVIPSARIGTINLVSGIETNEKTAILRGRRD